MRNKFFAVLGVAGTLMLVACSSDEGKSVATGNTGGGASAPVTATSSSSGNSNANSNANVVADGTVVLPQALDSNVGQSDAASAGIQSPQVQNRKDKVGKEGGPSGPPVDAAALAMKLARPAPDNSTFTSYLSDAGYEIRTFKNHPQLTKVEKKTSNDGSTTIKVFLRNGKVVDLPGQAIPILSTAPASQIMNAAGVPAPTAQANPNPNKPKQ